MSIGSVVRHHQMPPRMLPWLQDRHGASPHQVQLAPNKKTGKILVNNVQKMQDKHGITVITGTCVNL